MTQNNNTSNPSKGKRYICLARESDDKDGSKSTDCQIVWMREEADARGMIYVDSIALKGVSGSMPGKRKDLQGLLQRKRESDDFDVIVVQLVDRLTRGGCKHLFWFEFECEKVGLQVFYVGDDIPEGPYADMIKMAKAQAAKQQAFTISQRGTQGAQLAIEDGRKITSTHTPYGCWRLYLRGDGTPSHIIRDCGDGRQQKLNAETHEIIDTYGSVGGGSKGHYRKQKSEKVLLMPGDAAEQDVVREIFHLHFVQGWGGKRISGLLNERGIPSPWGKKWSQRQVEVVYEQEAYTGRSIGNRIGQGIYHERQAKKPKLVELDPMVLANAEAAPKRRRPIEEWTIQTQPFMEDFLDPKLRQLAMAAHEEAWKRWANPDRPKRSKSRHKGSEYLLSSILTALQDGETLTGILTGPSDKTIRYYRHRRSRRGYQKGSVFNNLIAADALEKEVLRVVQEVLSNLPDLRERLRHIVEQEMKAMALDQPKLDELRLQREKVVKRINLIVATLDEETLAEAKDQIDQLKADRGRLKEQIEALQSAQALTVGDPEAIVERVVEQLGRLADDVTQMPLYLLRQLLVNLIGSAVVDMETKAVELSFVLPAWVLTARKADAALCVEKSSSSPAFYQTQSVPRLVLATFTCRYIKRQTACYECRRRAA